MMGTHVQTSNPAEKRQYARLQTIFPVDFTIVRLQGDLPGIDWLRGYTANLSKGGLCLETSDIAEPIINYLTKESIYLDLRIFMPLAPKPLRAVGEIVWKKKDLDQSATKFTLGIEFRSMLKNDLKAMLKFTYGLKWISKAAVIASVIFFLSLLSYLIIQNFQHIF